MTGTTFSSDDYRGTGAENYERYFVPSIGAPFAHDLVDAAALHPGERVLDAACGTGIVARLAAAKVGTDGSVAGLDINPQMLAVARATSSDDIGWYEASVDAMPFADDSFDVALCQMGLQFVPDTGAALVEIRRVLADGGRLAFNLPGPTPEPFAALADALARHVDAQCAGFVNAVFSLHDRDALAALMASAGFDDVVSARARKTLQLPAPGAFLWQYIHGTPLAGQVAKATEEQRKALAAEVRERWQEFVDGDALVLQVDMTTVLGRC